MSISLSASNPGIFPLSPDFVPRDASASIYNSHAVADAPPAVQSSGPRDNPKWAAQYEQWKKKSFGKSETWKDSHIPAHLSVFREHDKAVESGFGVKKYSESNFTVTPEMRETTRNQIKAYYKETQGLDIDPDNTYLMTFVYNERGQQPPYPGKVVSKISLTEAAIKNIQDTPGHSSLPRVSFNNHIKTSPPIEIVDRLTIGYPRSSGRHGYQNSPTELKTQQYEGIYFESPEENRYDASNQAPISPKSFRKYVWDTSFSKAHKAQLQSFWDAYRETYTTLSKMSFASAAHQQFEENTLSREGRDLALRVANLTPDKPLASLTAAEFKQVYVQDPQLEIKELTFQGRVASGIFYVTDKTTQKTVLYMTGNSSPLHEFADPTQMRKWLTEQMTDVTKRQQFAQYFTLDDRADSVWEAGLDVHLEKTGKHASQHTDWLENRPFGGNSVEGDPFKSLQARVETYTFNDTASTYVSNDDWKKKNILKELKSASKSLLILAPVALAVPQVGVATLLFNLGIAATEIGFGVDDHIKGRPGAADRLTYGTFNAVRVIATELAGRVVAPLIKPGVESKILPKIIPQIDPIA